MEEQKELSKRERHELRKEERMQENEKNAAKRNSRRRLKNTAIISIVVLFIGVFTYTQLNKDYGPRFQQGKVHWHAKIHLETCGQYRTLENLGSEADHVGNLILHTHGDNLYHLEGSPAYVNEMTLGSFFDAIDVPVSNDRLYEYRNGDLCQNGTRGFIKMRVNGMLIPNIVAYAPQDNDTITISFG